MTENMIQKYRRKKDGVIVLARPMKDPDLVKAKREDSSGVTWYPYAWSYFLERHEKVVE